MSDALVGKTLYIDCFAGIAGDMMLAALVDLGVPEQVVQGEIAKLGLHGVELEWQTVKRGALVGKKLIVHEHEASHHEHGHHHHDHAHHHHDHHHYREIRAMLTRALVGETLRLALAIFDRIAAVEAKIHGVSVEEVAFHEVGAVDSIVDIVGAAAALAYLRPVRVLCRAIPLGQGTVKTAHGVLAVPAPATLALVGGMQVEGGGPSFELTTPTGAAILAALSPSFGALPSMTISASGWGAGTRELADRPNLLRLIVGEEARAAQTFGKTERLVVVEANVDDMNPEWVEPLLEALFLAGARDAWTASIAMKKGRPALVVSALCEPERREAVVTQMLRHSTSIGVRWHAVERVALERRSVDVETEYGKVFCKVAGVGEDDWNVAPEYEDCRRLAAECGVPVKEIYQAAIAAFRRR